MLTRLRRFISTSSREVGIRELLTRPGILRVMEAHSGLSALIADRTRVRLPCGEERGFDALWSSSLTASTLKGKPDIELVSVYERLSIVRDMLESSSLPIIYDGDTGGSAEVFHFTVKSLERAGVCAVVIEDKRGLKQNSLFGTERKQLIEDADVFCEKLIRGKRAQEGENFMIFARVEALIAGMGVTEALSRARLYVDFGQADGIMIHSKQRDAREIFQFMESFNASHPFVPVIAVPSTYPSVTEKSLAQSGIDIVIYANHQLRAAYPAMLSVCENILKNGRAEECEPDLMSIRDILEIIPDGQPIQQSTHSPDLKTMIA